MVEEVKRPVLKSQFSMGQLDFIRYDKLLSAADMYGVMVEDGNKDAIKPFFSCLNQFYRQIRWMTVKRQEADALKLRIKQNIRTMEDYEARGMDFSSVLANLRKDIELFANIVYELKQFCGLGINVEKVLSEKMKWERAARISNE